LAFLRLPGPEANARYVVPAVEDNRSSCAGKGVVTWLHGCISQSDTTYLQPSSDPVVVWLSRVLVYDFVLKPRHAVHIWAKKEKERESHRERFQ